MKKSCVFLLVMSIISLLISVLNAVGFIGWLHNSAYKIDIVNNFFLRTYLIYFLLFFLPGLFGIIGSIKRGRFTVVCIVLGSLFALYMLGEGAVYILQGVSIWVGDWIVFVYFALYTAAAAIAFKFRKAA